MKVINKFTIMLLFTLGIQQHSLAQVNEIIVFGDSLSDGGQFVDPSSPSFTPITFTNPENGAPGLTWVQRLAQRLGLTLTPSNSLNPVVPRGTNYAVGGFETPFIFSSITQTAVTPNPVNPAASLISPGYVVANPQANSNAMFFLWGGGNDLRNASRSGVDAALIMAGGTQALSNAGAKLIVVNNLPDLGRIPESAALGNQASRSSETLRFNATLNAALNSLNTDNILQTDIYRLFNEVLDAPTEYGFAAINHATTCLVSAPGLTGIQCANQRPDISPEELMFFDGIHPTTAGHELIADYIASILAAPGQFGALAENSLGVHRQTESVWNQALNTNLVDGKHSFFSANYIVTSGDDDRLRPETDADGLQLHFGQLASISDTVNAGWAVNLGYLEGDFNGLGAADFNSAVIKLAALGQIHHNNLFIDLSANVGYNDYDLDRNVELYKAQRVEKGSTDGLQYGASVAAKLDLAQSMELFVGPVAGLSYQRIELDGYKESGLSSTTLEFDDYDRNSLLGKIGISFWQQNKESEFDAELTYRRDFEDPDSVDTSVVSLQTNSFSLDAQHENDSWIALDFGYKLKLEDNSQLRIGYSGQFNNDNQFHGINLSISW